MTLTIRQLNPGPCKTYLVKRDDKDLAVLIDPLLNYVEDYLGLLAEEGLRLEAVIDTHTHADHLSGAPALKDASSCKYIMNEHSPLECTDIRLPDQADLTLLDGVKFQFIYTPGHNEDSMCVITDGAIFSGDTLFLGNAGAGRDDLPGGSPGSHWDSLQKLMVLDDELTVFPGHEYRGLQPTSLGTQKAENPYLNKKSKKDFIYFIEDLKLGAAEWMIDVVMANRSCTRDINAAEIHDESPACESKGTLSDDICSIDVPMLDAATLHSRLNNGNTPVVIDVRDEDEMNDEQGSIPGALNIPIDHIYDRIEEIESLKDRDLVLVCRSDPRSYTTGQILMDEGFDNIYVLRGGLVEWNHYREQDLSLADSQ